MNKLRAALIGCGRIGTKKHIEAFAANSDLIDLVAVCDLVPEKAERAAEEYMKRREISLNRGEGEKERIGEKDETQNGQSRLSSSPASEPDLQRPRVISDYKELFSSQIDFVTIATESGNHYKNTIDFLSWKTCPCRKTNGTVFGAHGSDDCPIEREEPETCRLRSKQV